MSSHAILSVALTLDCSALQKAAAQAASAVCAETRDTLETPKVVRCGKLPAAGTTRHYGEATKVSQNWTLAGYRGTISRPEQRPYRH
jgi:hypothetical protein